jgi:hypothetical protein
VKRSWIRTANAAMQLLAVILLFGLLGACDERRSDTSAPDPDTELMKDIGQSAPELERRLLSSVSVQDGLIVIHATSLDDTYVLPAGSPWLITCGRGGIWVTFGSAVSGDSSSVGNDAQIELTGASVNQGDCAVLGPSLGRRIRAMVQASPSQQQ